MDKIFPWYMAAWSSYLVLALTLIFLGRKSLSILRREYWRFLFKPWKVGTFVVATTGLTLIAPYTGDVTWDYPDALAMSVMTFASAPWAMGTLFLAVRGNASWRGVVIASALWMFSASWSYDLYILLKLGFYPPTWASNIVLSSVLYGSAGLFWNLDHSPKRGVHFAFTAQEWPSPNPNPVFNRVFWWALPLMLLASGMMLPFVWRYL